MICMYLRLLTKFDQIKFDQKAKFHQLRQNAANSVLFKVLFKPGNRQETASAHWTAAS